jgi:energy-coupling factor transport system ATP-binding protein
MAITLQNVSHVYAPGTPHEWRALDDITLQIGDGERWGIIGATGSGKSTLVQHMNGLLQPTSGVVRVDGVNLADKGLEMAVIRRKVGLVFQYPENQLFAETVWEDLAFGPRNVGLSEDRVREQVAWAAEQVRLRKELLDRAPFQLSGGEARRVAIAGVLAMGPRTLILDEPMAGLDPEGRQELHGLIDRLHAQGLTVVMVSHDMDDIARMAERVVVMDRGRVLLQGSPEEVFARVDELRRVRLGVPAPTRLLDLLAQRGAPVAPGAIRWADAVAQIAAATARRGQGGGGAV